MAKIALLIGVSDYSGALTSFPGTQPRLSLLLICSVGFGCHTRCLPKLLTQVTVTVKPA